MLNIERKTEGNELTLFVGEKLSVAMNFFFFQYLHEDFEIAVAQNQISIYSGYEQIK